jgi:hypothetical protein
VLISLKDLISEIEDEKLNELLSSFKCDLDPDIEFFLKSRAVTYEKLSKARTYLIVDENDLASKAIEEITILGYIALALKVLTVPESVSNRMRKEIDGLSAKIHGEQINAFPVYLIGQLGRNTNVSKDAISGKDLIGYAFDVIQPAIDSVGGRYILIECHDEEKLIQFYSDNLFTAFARIPDRERPMVQMIRKV